MQLEAAKYAISEGDRKDADSHLRRAGQLARSATVWAGESPAAQNELFNVTNGDTLRWQHPQDQLSCRTQGGLQFGFVLVRERSLQDFAA